ncbi:MAG: pitrilysin family protein [Candidatus Gastranaerophilales bacterium]|nr:pitrilysin family protein [Candidatus Gastranaerophilales bacterium]
MKVIPISKIYFTAGLESAKVEQPILASTSPMQKTQDLSNVTPSYNVKTPLKYTYLGTQELPGSITAHIYRLENGQRVVIIPKKGPTIVKTYVNVGSMNEPDRVRGISHFIEHNLFNGSDGLEAGEFFATVNKLGASTNASTGFAATDYYIESNLLKRHDLETEIKIHASMLETPRFAKEMLDKEKGPVTSEINMILDDPENVATNHTLKMLYGIDSTSKDIIGGSVANINALTRDDVVDYYQRNYYPANMVTVITGDVEPQSTMDFVSKYFRSRNTNPKPRNYEKLTPIQETVRNDFISDKTDAAIVCVGFNGPKNTDTKDKILLDAFQFFLVGSSVARLNKSLEEIQTNALISSDRIGTRPDDPMVVLFSTQTSEENAEHAIKKVFAEVADLERHPPTEEELNIVRKKLKLNLAQVFESSGIINTVVGTAMLDNDLQSVTEFEQVIDNLSAEDIVGFAKKYFDLNKVAITVVHPESADLQSIKGNYQRIHHVSFTGNSNEVLHKEALDTNKVSRYVATNNFSIVTQNIDKDLATFDLSLGTDAPADTKPGVSQLLGLMLNRGSKFKGEKQFFSDLENQGIQESFDASRRAIKVTSMFLPPDAVKAMQSTKEVLLNPRFTEEDLAEAKTFLRESIQNTPANSKEGLLKEMFKGQLYGTTTQDVLASLDSITLSDVQGLYQYIMNNAQGQIAISGPFSKNPNLKGDLMAELCKDFPVLKPAKLHLFKAYIPIEAPKVVVREHNKSQAEIEMGYKFRTNDNLEDAVKFNLLNTILGGTPSSRLFSDLRETQKLAYQVNSKLGYFDDCGVVTLFIKTTTDDPQTGTVSYDNVQKSLDGFNTHVQRLMREDVSEEELESAKLTLKNRILSGAELTADKNSQLLEGLNSFYGPDMINQVLDVIDTITVQDIRAAANYMFGTNPVISIVATKNTLDNKKPYLESLGSIVAA